MSSRRSAWRRFKMGALLFVVLAMINLPWVDGAVKDWRLASNGVDVTGSVTGHDVDDGRWLIQYSIPPGHDLKTGPYLVSVHEDEYEEARSTGEIDVRILPGNGVVRDVEGEVEGNLALLLTLLGDAAVLAFLFVLWKYGRYGRERDDDPPRDPSEPEEP